MVTSTACRKCRDYYDQLGRRDGGCRPGCRTAANTNYSDAELDILIGRYSAEEVKDISEETPPKP